MFDVVIEIQENPLSWQIIFCLFNHAPFKVIFVHIGSLWPNNSKTSFFVRSSAACFLLLLLWLRSSFFIIFTLSNG